MFFFLFSSFAYTLAKEENNKKDLKKKILDMYFTHSYLMNYTNQAMYIYKDRI